jgi:CxxC motif-containing protein
MSTVAKFVCISCPMGCPLQLSHEGDTIEEVSGNECNRGAKYAKQEFVDPRRTFSTTVPIARGVHARLPVKLSAPIQKDRVLEAMKEIRQLSAEAPVELGAILLTGLLGEEGIDVVATRSMKRV